LVLIFYQPDIMTLTTWWEQKVRTLIKNDFEKAFEKVDAIFTPNFLRQRPSKSRENVAIL
jgi:Asp-tRNA(Asn)/Glu-tRNA(Gln) amidotransferase A subunit family amidase